MLEAYQISSDTYISLIYYWTIAYQIIELVDVSILLYRLSQSSIRVVEDSESIVTMNARKCVHFQVKFDLNHPYVPTKEYILNTICA